LQQAREAKLPNFASPEKRKNISEAKIKSLARTRVLRGLAGHHHRDGRAQQNVPVPSSNLSACSNKQMTDPIQRPLHIGAQKYVGDFCASNH
jgi:hypothetical protein